MHEFLTWTGYSLEAVLLLRLLSWKAWRHFPVFFSYFLFLLARQGLIAYVQARYGTNSIPHSLWFWSTSNFSDVLKLLVAWEVFRKVFQPGSPAQRFTGGLLVGTLAGLSAFYSLGGAHDTLFFVAVGLNFAFVVTVWILGVLALAQYYGVWLGRNLWGIAMGLGLFSAIAVVNLSTLGLNDKAFPVVAFVRPASFVLSVLIWTWCLWSYRPAPRLSPAASPWDSSRLRGEPLEAAAQAVGRVLGQDKA
jgi:hypothetical protein